MGALMKPRSSITIGDADPQGWVLVTLDADFNDGQRMVLSLRQPMGRQTLDQIRDELFRQARLILDSWEGAGTPPAAPGG